MPCRSQHQAEHMPALSWTLTEPLGIHQAHSASTQIKVPILSWALVLALSTELIVLAPRCQHTEPMVPTPGWAFTKPSAGTQMPEFGELSKKEILWEKSRHQLAGDMGVYFKSP